MSETRACVNGALSGGYTNATGSATQPPDCAQVSSTSAQIAVNMADYWSQSSADSDPIKDFAAYTSDGVKYAAHSRYRAMPGTPGRYYLEEYDGNFNWLDTWDS